MTDPLLDMMAEDQAALAAASDHTPVQRLIAHLTPLRERIANGTALLERLQAEERLLVQRDVPDALKALGLRAMTLDDGTTVVLAESVQAKIPADQQPVAHAWLIAHGHGGVIKRMVAADVGKGEESDARATALLTMCTELGISATMAETVHPQTLKALVREILAGEDLNTPAEQQLPRAAFGVFVVEQAEVMPPKKKAR